ncbi:MAG TPA: M28 family metallopeptidase [Bryobacteraceae bacterium]|nr:M28 family metallopeptidase [Bryobacteraceae bacterium]
MVRSIAALLLLPFLLLSAGSTTIRGFDAASARSQFQWEKQARAVPDAARIRATVEKLAGEPHLAGTAGSKRTAEWLLAQLQSWGLDAKIETFEALLPMPQARILEMAGPPAFTAKLQEPAVAADPFSSNPSAVPPYNAYSGSGDVTAPLIYVNYGLPADYEILKQKGIDVRGRIVIARYGASFRGVKARVAWEHGAVGCIIFSDPRDDGYFQGDAFPKGPYRPAGGVQRGSVLDLGMQPGDPLSPGWASEPGARRLSVAEAATIQQIPVLPISYEDATPLLAALTGPVAPESWRGALPITYHLGPSTPVHLKVTMNNETRPLYNVIATIPGTAFPDEWILHGNHHDAWVGGANDPLSGAAPLLESARALSEMLKKGWRPKRTVKIAFWDGEEFGLVGSTEWMEKHANELSAKLAVYINSDSSGSGPLSAGGSHSLEEAVREILRDVNDPVSGKSLLDERQSRSQKGADPGFHLSPLGSGSDYTPFLQHLGIASLNFGFENTAGNGVYHSAYDDFYWVSHFEDPHFAYGRALAELDTTVMMRLSDAPLLPFEFGHVAAAVTSYLEDISHLPKAKDSVNLDAARRAAEKLAQAAREFDKAWDHAESKLEAENTARLAEIDRLLMASEQDLTLSPGLPGRPWYRHRIYAPGRYTGYSVKTLPGIREAVEAGRTDEAGEQTKEVAQVLEKLAADVDAAAKLIAKL